MNQVLRRGSELAETILDDGEYLSSWSRKISEGEWGPRDRSHLCDIFIASQEVLNEVCES